MLSPEGPPVVTLASYSQADLVSRGQTLFRAGTLSLAPLRKIGPGHVRLAIYRYTFFNSKVVESHILRNGIVTKFSQVTSLNVVYNII